MLNLVVYAKIWQYLVDLVSTGSAGACWEAHCAEICGDYLHHIGNSSGLPASNKEMSGAE